MLINEPRSIKPGYYTLILTTYKFGEPGNVD